MSRRWIFEQDSLVIEDHNCKQLVQMKQNTARRFEGEMANHELGVAGALEHNPAK